MTRILVVTAAGAERDAVLKGRNPTAGAAGEVDTLRSTTAAGVVDVVASGVGLPAATVAACWALRPPSSRSDASADSRDNSRYDSPYDLVICAGIAGGFPAAEVGSVAVSHAVVHADLGAETDSGFSSMAELGWGPVRFEIDQPLAELVSRRTDAVLGSVLTVSTVTGSQARADELHAAYPDAVAEAMEGVGVHRAASRFGVPFVEIRTISNRVGPRNRDNWQITEALAALTAAFDGLLASPLPLRIQGDPA
ncbi:futalosine hydrolase [Jatrophihabitans sp. DSM 45814]